jgi:hypothetical protein
MKAGRGAENAGRSIIGVAGRGIIGVIIGVGLDNWGRTTGNR